jgi:predicted ArsR family transcriptional regulator
MTKAQIKTFDQLKKSGKVETTTEAVLERLRISQCSVNRLKKDLNLKQSTIVGRISELCDQGKVKVERKFRNEWGNWNSIYKLTYEGEQKRLQQKRKNEKIQRYKAFLESEGYKVLKKY